MFIVEHIYQVDGGFGDAVNQRDIVAAFENEKDAEEYVKKYSNHEVYDSPYDELTCGLLRVAEIKPFTIPKEEMWWL